MDAPATNLYFSNMAAAPRRPRTNHAPVPAFFLYGEALQAPDERVVHVETLEARSRLHDWTIRPHRHRDLHQVLLTERGRADVRLDGADHHLRGPLAIVVPPGTVHAFRFQPDTPGLVVSFSAGFARELAATGPGVVEFLDRAAAIPLARDELASTDLAALGGMLLREFGRSAPGRHVALRGLLGALLANLMRVAQGSAPPEGATPDRPDRELVARFRQIVERRYREHAGVAEYAAELGTSEARLRRACIAVAGQSPIELVHLRLLVEAERQLRYTSMPVTQVAYFLGFEDPAYFTRFFTRRMRASPRAFRAATGSEID
jgi:AraC family transcriptional activator of pobA